MLDHEEQLAGRLDAMYQRMKEAQVDLYLVPSSDAHLNEYVPEYSRRRAAVTGFTGSAGDAIISPHGNHIFVDSRYHLQADEEVDLNSFRVHRLGLSGEFTLSQWLTEMEKERGGIQVGFDPAVISMQAHKFYSSALHSEGSAMVPIAGNLVDDVWEEQPNPPSNGIYALHESVTGIGVSEKLSNVRKEMADAGVDKLVITKLDEIAWVTNLRGDDIQFNPVFEAYMVIEMERSTCFTRVKLPAGLIDQLSPLVEFQPYESYSEFMRLVGSDSSGVVWLDPSGTTMATRILISNDQKVHERPNPVVMLKAIKNNSEVLASREAHRHAAAAKIRSFKGLEEKIACGQVVSELDYSQSLHEEYAKEDGFYDLSFTTIAASGPNGAIVHYSDADPEVLLEEGELFLVDSGVQMLGGTTDDTRTVIVGNPTDRQKQVYTKVLRGHINLAMQKFPEGTGGIALDALARTHLWNVGLDYGHGTGHGVGYFLNVHEGPQSLSKLNDVKLNQGMIVSNEPGYYETNKFGIRIENLIYIKKVKAKLKFENLTLAPIEKDLINFKLLNYNEKKIFNGLS